MYTAACLCGAIKLEIHQKIETIYACHCKECQKAQGTAFVAVTEIQTQNLNFLSGKDAISEYFFTENKKRCFCKFCGSPIFSARLDLPNVLRLRVGIINEELNAQLYSHAFIAEKAPWFKIAEDRAHRFFKHVEF